MFVTLNIIHFTSKKIAKQQTTPKKILGFLYANLCLYAILLVESKAIAHKKIQAQPSSRCHMRGRPVRGGISHDTVIHQRPRCGVQGWVRPRYQLVPDLGHGDDHLQ